MDLYAAAWERGVKTTYYLHMKPRHTAEQSTVRVNKTEKINSTGSANGRGAGSSGPTKKGFGGFGGTKKEGFGTATATTDAVAGSETAADQIEAPVAPEPTAAAPAPAKRGFGSVAAPAAAPVGPAPDSAETAPASTIAMAPAAVMSSLATKAFAPAPIEKPVVPPSALPVPAVEPTATGEVAEVAAGPGYDAVAPEGATVLEVVETVYSADSDMEMVDGVACPVDPMERLQCESCQ